MSSFAKRLVTDEGDRKEGNPASSEKEKPFRISGQIVVQKILVVNRIACFLSEQLPKVRGGIVGENVWSAAELQEV